MIDKLIRGVHYIQRAVPNRNYRGFVSKELLVRDEDVQVLHGFCSAADAKAYLESKLFNKDVVAGLKLLLQAEPEIRIYSAY
ncbi:hypothetical protein DFP94_101118 [Fontibacillus phaseoli]|uniref:Antibiotic biosynthesis monooxygenase n=1 Tax=Fontibacillus phaseoli TaxID=1416533 RepID=A0A369BPH8_9BACL|nr:hypothetical protein DFP94_101118 [Fontibacillus phaseoli]